MKITQNKILLTSIYLGIFLFSFNADAVVISASSNAYIHQLTATDNLCSVGMSRSRDDTVIWKTKTWDCSTRYGSELFDLAKMAFLLNQRVMVVYSEINDDLLSITVN